MFVNAVKSSGWSAKTNGAQPCGQFVWIKSARKITKKNANSKAISVFLFIFLYWMSGKIFNHAEAEAKYSFRSIRRRCRCHSCRGIETDVPSYGIPLIFIRV